MPSTPQPLPMWAIANLVLGKTFAATMVLSLVLHVAFGQLRVQGVLPWDHFASAEYVLAVSLGIAWGIIGWFGARHVNLGPQRFAMAIAALWVTVVANVIVLLCAAIAILFVQSGLLLVYPLVLALVLFISVPRVSAVLRAAKDGG